MHTPAAPSGTPIHFLPSGRGRLARRIPAAVLLAEVLADIGDVDQLFGIEVGVVVGRQDDVRTGAGVGRDRRLRAHVLPALVVDAHLDAGLVGERLDVDHVLVDVALHEAAPAQHAQLRALLRLVVPLRARVLDPDERAGRGAGRDAGRAFRNLRRLNSLMSSSFGNGSIVLRCPVRNLRRRAARRSPRRTDARARGRARGGSGAPGRQSWRSRNIAVSSWPLSGKRAACRRRSARPRRPRPAMPAGAERAVLGPRAVDHLLAVARRARPAAAAAWTPSANATSGAAPPARACRE